MQGPGGPDPRGVQHGEGAASEAQVDQEHGDQNHIAKAKHLAVHDLDAHRLQLDVHGVELLEAALQPMVRYEGRQVDDGHSDESTHDLHHVPEIGDPRAKEVAGHRLAIIVYSQAIADGIEGNVQQSIQIPKDGLLDAPASGLAVAAQVERGEAVDVGHMEERTEALVELLGAQKTPESTTQGLTQTGGHFNLHRIHGIRRVLGPLDIHVRSVWAPAGD